MSINEKKKKSIWQNSISIPDKALIKLEIYNFFNMTKDSYKKHKG